MNHLRTECAKAVRFMQILLITPLMGLWYRLTARIPRKLPQTEEEFQKLMHCLSTYFGIKPDPDNIMTICGQITSTPAVKMRKPYINYVNAALRLKVNLAAHTQKVIAGEELKAKLEEAVKKLAEDEKAKDESTVQSGASGIQRDLSLMQ